MIKLKQKFNGIGRNFVEDVLLVFLFVLVVVGIVVNVMNDPSTTNTNVQPEKVQDVDFVN